MLTAKEARQRVNERSIRKFLSDLSEVLLEIDKYADTGNRQYICAIINKEQADNIVETLIRALGYHVSVLRCPIIVEPKVDVPDITADASILSINW